MPKVNKEVTCQIDCKLCEGCHSPFMKADGDINSELLLIGEAPGETEDLGGKPFIGDAGELLQDALSKANITKWYMTNAVRCRPLNNRNPTAKELKACYPRLLEDIKSMPNLKLIVLLGNIALQTFCKMKGISKYTGKTMTYDGYKVMPILHPAYILRNQKELKTFFDHIARISNALSGTLVSLGDFGKYKTITTLAEWKELFRELRLRRKFVYDIETSSLSPFVEGSRIKCIGFSTKSYTASTLPIGFLSWEDKEWREIYEDLVMLFESETIFKIGHNIKFDNLWMKEYLKINVKGTYWDTQISQFLLNENASRGLKDLAWAHTKIGGYETRLSTTPDKAEGEELYVYNSTDTDVTFRIYDHHREELAKETRLSLLFHNLLIPVSDVLANMESAGIRIDPDRLLECEKNCDNILISINKEIKRENSVIDFERDREGEINLNSPLQLRELLFKYEGLKPIKLTKKIKAPSTDKEVLEELANESHLCELLKDYSSYSTTKSKMIEELKKYKTPNNRIHTCYWLTNTATGRTSSEKPNLQNVIKGEKDVIGIRNIFIADPDCYLVEFDYNQMELRCMAEEAEDQAMIEALKGDVHRSTASWVLNKDYNLITEEERKETGKTFNFGLIYGLTKWGISKRLKCSEAQAEEYLSKFFAKYHKIREWQQSVIKFVHQYHYVESRTGRKRRFPLWKGRTFFKKDVEEMEKEAINFPIQSLASDILLYSLVRIAKLLENGKSTLNLEVHDSIICNIHKTERDLIPEIKDIMLTYFRTFILFKTQLAVDVKVGEDWGSMEEIQI